MKIPLSVLPAMKCDSDCGGCCGPVLCKEHEYQAIKAYAKAHNLSPRNNGERTCPWLHDKQCSVYPVRPFICQMFGHSPRLVCERGYNVNIHPGLEKRLAKNYGLTTRLLHEILGEHP